MFSSIKIPNSKKYAENMLNKSPNMTLKKPLKTSIRHCHYLWSGVTGPTLIESVWCPNRVRTMPESSACVLADPCLSSSHAEHMSTSNGIGWATSCQACTPIRTNQAGQSIENALLGFYIGSLPCAALG